MSEAALERLSAAIRSAVTRGQVLGSGVTARSVILVQGLANERFATELLLPPGMSARPMPGADVLILQALGSRDHAVAICGDATGDAIPDLAEGEFGFSFGGCRIVMRTDHVEITTTGGKAVAINADGPVTIASATAGVIVTSTTGIELNAPAVTVNGHAVATL